MNQQIPGEKGDQNGTTATAFRQQETMGLVLVVRDRNRRAGLRTIEWDLGLGDILQ
jgi:hypothetical protein